MGCFGGKLSQKSFYFYIINVCWGIPIAKRGLKPIGMWGLKDLVISELISNFASFFGLTRCHIIANSLRDR